MPRKAKEKLEEDTKISGVKKGGTQKKTTTKKTNNNKTTSKKANSKSASSKGGKAKTSTTIKRTTSTKKKTSNKKSTTLEYYDLPYRYNQTIVKILAQTPNILFVYWDISDNDKEKLIKQYGNNFFQNTKPYLLVTNENMNYQFEVEVNDYANSWYLHITDSDCKYRVELIRRPVNEEIKIESSVTCIASSNDLETPNDHILFDHLGKNVFFKNTKNNTTVSKDISTLSLINHIGKIYNVYNLYKEIYRDELNVDELGTKLLSSQFSSNFK